MASTPTHRRTVPNGRGPLRDLDGVELFSVGQKNDAAGEVWTAGQLRQLAENFQRFFDGQNPHYEPFAELGHEIDMADLRARLRDDAEYQAYVAKLDPRDVFKARTAKPAAGWPRNVTFDPATGKLRGDLKDIPPSIADMIDLGQFRTVSPIIYPDFKYEGKSYGPVLRSIGLLGACPPADKNLAPLTPAAFADQYGECRAFAAVEIPKMPLTKEQKQELIGRIRERQPWLAEAVLAALSDDSLSAVDAAAPKPEPKPAPAPTPTPAPNPNPPTPAPNPPAPTPQPTAVSPEVAAAFAEQMKGEIRKQVAAAFAEATAPVKKQAKIDGWRERNRPYLIPADSDRGDPKTPCLMELLDGYDDTRAVRTFSENGQQVQKTQLDLELDRAERELRATRKPAAFGDVLPTPAGGTLAAVLDRAAEEGKNARKSEQNGKPLLERVGLR